MTPSPEGLKMTSAYVPNRKPINAEGQETIPIRMSRNRIAWLILPIDFDETDAEHLAKWIHLIAEGGRENIRNPGPPEPSGRLP